MKTSAAFVGHGSPMNIVLDNAYTRSLREWGAAMEKPKAVLVVSAHWMSRGRTLVCASERPKQIFDFYGFPRELYEVGYDAPGEPDVARRAAELVGGDAVDDWGADHAAWAVMCHVFPEADVPVVMMSIDMTKPGPWHAEQAKKLGPLRDEGVLILGSGNIVHNLPAADLADIDGTPDKRGVAFDAWVAERLEAHDVDALAAYTDHGEMAQFAAPTPDHYLPMLYPAALMKDDERPEFFCTEFQNISISMRSFDVRG